MIDGWRMTELNGMVALIEGMGSKEKGSHERKSFSDGLAFPSLP